MSTCKFDKCDKPVETAGCCQNHYLKLARDKAKESREIFNGGVTESELLNIASTPSTDKLDKLKMHEAMRFIIAKNIQTGDYKINAKVVVYSYLAWSATPTNARDFSIYFNKIYKPKVSTHDKYYSLNVEPFMSLLEEGKAILNDVKVELREDYEQEEKASKI